MRIARLHIDNYGPLRDNYWELAPGMTLFYGPNESGKTLLVESILKLLLDGNTSGIDGIDRVTGNPAGFLVVETDTGEIQLPDADYTDLFPPGTTRADIRNAFVIRDYDLRLPDRRRDFGHTTYYRDVTDRLLGAQTQQIESVQEHIADIGNLANNESTRLMNRAPVKLKDRYEAAQSLVAQLESYLTHCEESDVLGNIRERREKEKELSRIREEIQELEAAKQQARLTTGQSLVAKLETIEDQIRAHTNRTDEISEYKELRRRIDSFRDSSSAPELEIRPYIYGIVVSSGLFTITVIGAIFSPLPGLTAVSGAVLLIIVYLGYQYYDARNHLHKRNELVEAANYMGVTGDDLAGVYQELESRIENHETEREQLSHERSETIGKLKGEFDADHESLGAWEDELASFEATVPRADRSFDQAELDRLRSTRESVRETLESLQQDLQAHHERLAEFDRELQEIHPSEFLAETTSLRVQSVTDLPDAINGLEEFITEIETTRDQALVGIEVFNELEAEEEQEINRLFDANSFVVSMFEEVTDGHYTDVWFDDDSGIRVERADGQGLSPYELSQGTYDLLYLTIRLQLASKLLNDEPGFLLLDDAFVHSDASRVAREIEVLTELVAAGWQIVYFSFRDSIREAVATAEAGSIIELDSLSFST